MRNEIKQNQGLIAAQSFALAGLCLIALAGCGTAEKVSSEPPKAEQVEEKTAEKHGIGDKFAVGDLAYDFIQTDRLPRIGEKGGIATKEADPGSLFLVIGYAVMNISKEPKTISVDPFKLRAPDGSIYEVDQSAQYAVNLAEHGQQDQLLAQIGPRTGKSRICVFQIPKDLKTKDLTLLVSDDNPLNGADPVEVALK